MSESASSPVESSPKPLSQQFFDVAQGHRARARDLRNETPGSNVDADALDALAKDSQLVADLFAPALLTFAGGVVVAVLVAGSSYLTQLYYGEEAKKKLAVRLHIFSAVLWFVTTGVFAAGCVETYIAVRSMPKREETPVTIKSASSESPDFKRNAPPPRKPPPEPPQPKPR